MHLSLFRPLSLGKNLRESFFPINGGWSFQSHRLAIHRVLSCTRSEHWLKYDSKVLGQQQAANTRRIGYTSPSPNLETSRSLRDSTPTTIETFNR